MIRLSQKVKVNPMMVNIGYVSSSQIVWSNGVDLTHSGSFDEAYFGIFLVTVRKLTHIGSPYDLVHLDRAQWIIQLGLHTLYVCIL